MTKDSDFKALVRARMRKTGERYAAARAALAPPTTPTDQRPSLPAGVAGLVDAHLARLDEAIPRRIVGFHLVGSVGYGDYRSGKSDVDFVAVLDDPLTGDDLEAIRRAHQASTARPALDGIYTTRQQLREGDTPEARFHDGLLAPHDEYGVTPVTRRELVTVGVPIRGRIDPTEIEHDAIELRRWVRANLDDYWTSWVRRASGWTPLAIYALLPQGVEWSVLGIARMLYTLETGDVTSKTAVATWAIDHVDDRFEDILRTAQKIRQGRAGNIFSMFDRKAQALAFMAHVLQTAPPAP
jgi:hypothetical protein